MKYIRSNKLELISSNLEIEILSSFTVMLIKDGVCYKFFQKFVHISKGSGRQ